MSGFPLDSSAIFKHYERKSLIMPDRQKETAAAWMKTHPEITHVSRDRSSEYASAVSAGAPQAIQVADRFHVAVRRIGAYSIPLEKGEVESE